MTLAVNDQTRPAPDGGNRLFPSLRPFWGRLLHPRSYDIRPTRTPDQQAVVNTLLRRMYAWRGHAAESRVHRLDDPNRVTLAAWQFDEVMATLTLGRDSPEGLPTDALFTGELARLRRPDRMLCEFSSLAVDPDFSSTALLTTLFQTALHYARHILSASDAVIEVDPRHARYFQRRMGFRQIGKLRQCQNIDVPVLLLHKELGGMTFACA